MNLFQRLWDSFGFENQFEDYEDYGEGELDPDYSDAPAQTGNPPRLPGAKAEVMLMKPRSFDEISQAVTALRERKAVILNLGLMDAAQAQRCADYVAGGAFAIDGHQKQLSPSVFLFTPSFVQISDQAAVVPPAQPQPAPARNPYMPPQPPFHRAGEQPQMG